MLLHIVSKSEHRSLSYMSSFLQSDFGIEITKQSLNERFTDKCTAFIKSVLSEFLEEQFCDLYSTQLTAAFSRILVKDSTRFMTPKSMQDDYRYGGGDVNSRSKSAVSIQYEFDLLSGKVTDLNLTAGNRNDRTDAGKSVDKIEAGSLIVRDLGYLSTPVWKECEEKRAFYLSRLDCITKVYDLNGKEISFNEVYKSMQKSGIGRKEISVLVGKDTKLQSRLILQIVPDQVYEQRIREKTKKSKGQGRGTLADETKIRSRFNLFVTNASESQLSTEQVFPLYRLRWQIELHFKTWKSIYRIDTYQEMKKERCLSMIYMKLLLIVLSQQITYSLQQSIPQKDPKKLQILSLNKCLKTLKCLFNKIFTILRSSRKKAKEEVEYIRKRLLQNHWLESKKKKLCSPEIISLIISVSEE